MSVITPVNQIAILQVIRHRVEEHGCRIVDVDFEHRKIEIDGPENMLAECAHALADIFD